MINKTDDMIFVNFLTYLSFVGNVSDNGSAIKTILFSFVMFVDVSYKINVELISFLNFGVSKKKI